MDLSHRSMAALWMAGFEDDEEQLRCGELCVVEVFGNALRPGSAEVGVGIKAFRDPALTQDFAAPRVDVDVSGFHTYAVDWDADVAVFTVDGEELRRCPRPPTYPLQLMVAVFDFPADSTGDDHDLVPRLVVDHVAGW
jgi:beta-glucanase (GH16 family)